MNLLELTFDQLTAHFKERYGKGAYHADALYRAFYQAADVHLDRLPAFAHAPHLLKAVGRDLSHHLPAIVGRQSDEGVTKLAFRLADGLVVETVVIPMASHATVCISSQVGCRMGCRFCETGRMGLTRNLTAAEIVAQVHAVRTRMGIDVRNIVFMGMGEPLDNFDPVVQAIRVIEDQRGLNIAKRRVTLSTAGLVDGIRALAALQWPQLKLAVSLNAPDDAVRSAVMPVNRRHDMAALQEALRHYPLARGNVLLMEYVLIKGVNDQPAHAAALAGYLQTLPSVRLNLIVYNPRRESPYDAPDQPAVDRFHQVLIDHKIFVRLRKSKGAGIRAACGQLSGRWTHVDPAPADTI